MQVNSKAVSSLPLWGAGMCRGLEECGKTVLESSICLSTGPLLPFPQHALDRRNHNTRWGSQGWILQDPVLW